VLVIPKLKESLKYEVGDLYPGYFIYAALIVWAGTFIGMVRRIVNKIMP